VALDLDAYARRLGIARPARADLAALRRLHLAHLAAIPFENLDVQMGVPVRLDIDHLQRKLVDRRRGGYCFEQNTLLMHALRTLGFDVMPCEARVSTGSGTILPRTHMLLVVHLDGRDWLCDVGFGGSGLLEPAPLDGEAVTQHGWTYRIARHGGLSALQWQRDGQWHDLYVFEAAERYEADFEMGNWYTSTFPESRFVTTLTAQRATPAVRYVLRDYAYSEDRGDAVDAWTIDRSELVPLLRGTFGIDVPEDARFRALD
jgi:N-hydroxyarylamine O-acetyltransferase